MAFTMPNYHKLSPEEVNPFNAALTKAFQTYGQGLQAAYAPKMAEAEIFHKQFAPLAEFASSPLALGLAPAQRNQVLGYISQLLSQTGTKSGNSGSTNAAISLNQGSQNTTGEPIKGTADHFRQENDIPAKNETQENVNSGMQYDTEGNNVIGNPTQSTSNIPQAGGDVSSGAEAKAIAPFNQQVYPAGTTYFDPSSKQFKTTASDQTLSQDQVGMGAIQVAIPLLEKLKEESKEVLSEGKTFKLLSSMGASALQNLGASPQLLKSLKISPDYYDKYVQFHKDITNVAERVHAAYKYAGTNTGHAEASSLIEPGRLQNSSGYRKSIDQEISNLKKQNDIYKEHMTGGYQVSPGSSVSTPRNNLQGNESSSEVPGDIGYIPAPGPGKNTVKMRTPPEPGYPDGQEWDVPYNDKAIGEAIRIGARAVRQ